MLARVEISKAKYNLSNLLVHTKNDYVILPLPQVIYNGAINFGIGLVKET